MAKLASQQMIEFLLAVMILLVLASARWAHSDAVFASQFMAALDRAALGPMAGLW